MIPAVHTRAAREGDRAQQVSPRLTSHNRLWQHLGTVASSSQSLEV